MGFFAKWIFKKMFKLWIRRKDLVGGRTVLTLNIKLLYYTPPVLFHKYTPQPPSAWHHFTVLPPPPHPYHSLTDRLLETKSLVSPHYTAPPVFTIRSLSQRSPIRREITWIALSIPPFMYSISSPPSYRSSTRREITWITFSIPPSCIPHQTLLLIDHLLDMKSLE